MAVERDFELLDDYLANRLNANDATAFEKQVQADPQLAQELNIQKDLVEGLKKARATELKAMLNNIPVSPIPSGSTFVKVGTSVVVAGLIATGLYFYFTQDETTVVNNPASEQTDSNIPQVMEAPENTAPQNQPEQNQSEQQPALTEERETKKEKTSTAIKPAVTPKPDVYDPATEDAHQAVKQYEKDQLEVISKSFVTSSTEVEMDTMNKKYTFHYVFNDGKLILYGAFEKQLYEILEFIGNEKRTVVLFYKTNYYLLDINKTTPTKLSPIHDAKLLKKLKEHRSK